MANKNELEVQEKRTVEERGESTVPALDVEGRLPE